MDSTTQTNPTVPGPATTSASSPADAGGVSQASVPLVQSTLPQAVKKTRARKKPVTTDTDPAQKTPANAPTAPVGLPSPSAPGVTPAPATPSVTLKAPLKPLLKLKRKPAAKFKPGIADHLLLRAVQSGLTLGQFAAVNNLDLDALNARVDKLVRNKFVTRNPADPQFLHLGLAGLEVLSKLDEKKQNANRDARPTYASTPSTPAPAAPPTLSAPSPLHESPTPVEIKPTTQRKVDEFEEEQRDLIELMQEERKKAQAAGLIGKTPSPARQSPALSHMPFTPTTPNPLISGMPRTPTTPTTSALRQAVTPGTLPVSSSAGATVDSCEVCKTSFKNSIREPQLAKYANCVCGAPFHQDCYDGTIDTGDGKCPRCSRTLKPILGRGANEALSDIKDAFG